MNKLWAVVLSLSLAACSTSAPPKLPNQPDEPVPIPPLELVSCLYVNVFAPKVVPEGEGFTAEVRMHNYCSSNVKVPLRTSVNNDGTPAADTGFPFYLMVTDPSENDNGSYTLRWTSKTENPDRRLKTEWVELVPYRVLTQKITWDGRDEEGTVLGKGNYMVFGGYSYAPYRPADMRFVEVWSIKPFKITKK